MEKLGIEPIQLLTQLFNFLVLVFVLGKLLYKPILKVLEERKRKIAEGLEYTEKMKRELEKNEEKREEIIAVAKKEARQIIEEGKKSGKKLEEEIVANAHKQEAAIFAHGKKEIDFEKSEMEKELKKEAIDIASAMVEKILSDTLTLGDHKSIIEKKIRLLSNLKK